MMGLRTNAGNMAKGKQPVRWDQESSEDEQEPGKVGFSHSEGDSDEDPVTSGSASLHESSESEAEPQASTYAQFQGESDLEDEEDLDDSDIRDSQESSEAEASEADTEQDDDEATERALRQSEYGLQRPIPRLIDKLTSNPLYHGQKWRQFLSESS